MGRQDIRSYLAVRVASLTEKEAQDFTEPQYEVDESGDFVWNLAVDDNPKAESKTSGSIGQPPDEHEGWSLSIAKKRRRNLRWLNLLSDIGETSEAIRDTHYPVGHEIDEAGTMRYTSKTQPTQAKTRIERKQPITRVIR